MVTTQRQVIEPIAEQGVRVVAPDLPGFGLPSLPSDTQWDPCRDYWADPTETNKNRIEPWLDYEGTKRQYVWHLPDRLARHYLLETHSRDALTYIKPFIGRLAVR